MRKLFLGLALLSMTAFFFVACGPAEEVVVDDAEVVVEDPAVEPEMEEEEVEEEEEEVEVAE